MAKEVITIESLQAEIKTANELNEALSASLKAVESVVPKGAMPIEIKGKLYRVVAPKFNLDSVKYTADDVRNNQELQLKLSSKDKAGNLIYGILIEL